MADHNKGKMVVSAVRSSSVNDDECLMKSFIVPVPKFPSDTKFLSDVLTVKYTLLFLRPQTPVFQHQNRCDLCSDGGGGEGGHTYVKDITFRK